MLELILEALKWISDTIIILIAAIASISATSFQVPDLPSSLETPHVAPLHTEVSTDDNWVIKVTSVDKNYVNTTAYESTNPRKGYQFVAADVQATCYDFQECYISAHQFTAVGKSGTKYHGVYYGCGEIPNLLDAREERGYTVYGTVCFEVKKRDVQNLVMYYNFYLSGETRAWFKLY